MKKFIIGLIFLSFACARHAYEKDIYIISSDIYESFKLTPDFEQRIEIKLKVEPITRLFKEWKKKHPDIKDSATEANLQVMTETEFKTLTKVISKQKITEMALTNSLQNARFSVICIGMKQQLNDAEKGYVILVESDDIIRFRFKLQKEYLKRGGDMRDFYPSTFVPYIPFASTSLTFDLLKLSFDKKECVAKLKSSQEI